MRRVLAANPNQQKTMGRLKGRKQNQKMGGPKSKRDFQQQKKTAAWGKNAENFTGGRVSGGKLNEGGKEEYGVSPGPLEEKRTIKEGES